MKDIKDFTKEELNKIGISPERMGEDMSFKATGTQLLYIDPLPNDLTQQQHRYIMGIDPYLEYDIDSKVYVLTAAEIIERFKEHLTEEQIKSLENNGK